MKIIGTTAEYGGEYICTVGHTELEKFLGLYYDKLKRLNVGDTVDLGKAYDYASQIKSGLDETRKFIAAHQTVINAICRGLSIEALQRAADETALEFGKPEKAA